MWFHEERKYPAATGAYETVRQVRSHGCDPFPRNGQSKDGDQDKERRYQTILDNLLFVQVQFLPPGCQGEALPPSGRLTLKPTKRG